MPIAELLVTVAHFAPPAVITGRADTPQRHHLLPAQIFYVNGHWLVIGRHLLDDGAVEPIGSLETNLAAVSYSELHPSSDAVIHLLLGSLGLVPDIVLDISEQCRVQRSLHPLRQPTPTAPVALVVLCGSRAGSIFHPQRLVYIQVGVVAAGAGRHAVVAQEVGGSADPLTGTQIAAVHLKHAFVQQLVQDGLAERGVLDPADGINAVIVIPVQEAQLHLVLEVVACDVDGWLAGLLEDQKIPLVHGGQRVDLHLSHPLLWILKLAQVVLKVTFNKRLIGVSVLLQKLHTLRPDFSMKALAMQHLLGDSPKQTGPVFGYLLPMQTDRFQVVIH